MSADLSSTPLDALLRDVEQLCEAATPGPWISEPCNGGFIVANTLPEHVAMCDMAAPEANAAFMAAARELLPLLARRLREMETENKDTERSNEALMVKVRSLSAHETCGCSYDRSGDVCMHHSPQLTAALTELSFVRAVSVRLAKDAERLDWLEDEIPPINYRSVVGTTLDGSEQDASWWEVRHSCADTLRAAIDAAIRAAGQQETATEKAMGADDQREFDTRVNKRILSMTPPSLGGADLSSSGAAGGGGEEEGRNSTDTPPATVPPSAEQCEGRYPVPGPRYEPFEVTYRCALRSGHTGPHGAAPPSIEEPPRKQESR